MKIDCIADLHGYQPKLEGGDLLIVAGDLTARDKLSEWAVFFSWLSQQYYTKKIIIAGNHDGQLEHGMPKNQKEADELKAVQDFLQEVDEAEKPEFEYLCDYGTEFEGLKIWGSPWTPTFFNWHFMKKRGEEIKKQWDLIPDDTDILITHGPAYGILDVSGFSRKRVGGTNHCGCEELRNAVERVKPKLHVFGHIHESYGETVLLFDNTDTRCVNASIMDGDYNPVNKPIRVVL